VPVLPLLRPRRARLQCDRSMIDLSVHDASHIERPIRQDNWLQMQQIRRSGSGKKSRVSMRVFQFMLEVARIWR
jgi:hypothetical protein